MSNTENLTQSGEQEDARDVRECELYSDTERAYRARLRESICRVFESPNIETGTLAFIFGALNTWECISVPNKIEDFVATMREYFDRPN